MSQPLPDQLIAVCENNGRVYKVVDLYPENRPHVWRWRFNFRTIESFKVGLYTLPHKQALTFRHINKEQAFYNYCFPCDLYRNGSCRGGIRLMNGSRITTGRGGGASDLRCFKRISVRESDKTVLVEHPPLYIQGMVTDSSRFRSKQVFSFRPRQDVPENLPANATFESMLEVLPYFLANVYYSDGRICLGGRDYESVLYDEFDRTFTQHYDWGSVNNDLQPDQSVPINDWLTNYADHQKRIVENTDSYPSTYWKPFSRCFNDSPDYADYRLSIEKGEYTHFIRSRNSNSSGGTVRVMHFINANDLTQPIVRMQYGYDLSSFNRREQTLQGVLEELGAQS